MTGTVTSSAATQPRPAGPQGASATPDTGPRTGGPPVDAIDVAAYTIPTDTPELDGTLAWDDTTIVVVEAEADGVRALGYAYAHPAAAHARRRRPPTSRRGPGRVGRVRCLGNGRGRGPEPRAAGPCGHRDLRPRQRRVGPQGSPPGPVAWSICWAAVVTR